MLEVAGSPYVNIAFHAFKFVLNYLIIFPKNKKHLSLNSFSCFVFSFSWMKDKCATDSFYLFLSKFLFAFFICTSDLLRFLLSSLLASLNNIFLLIKPYEAGHCEKLCKAVKFVLLLLPIFQIHVGH